MEHTCTDYANYSNLNQEFSFRDKGDINFLLDVIKYKLDLDKLDEMFNPLIAVLSYFNQESVPYDILEYFTDRIVPFLKSIFNNVPDGTKSIILQTLYCHQTEDSTQFFVDSIINIDNHLDDIITTL